MRVVAALPVVPDAGPVCTTWVTRLLQADLLEAARGLPGLGAPVRAGLQSALDPADRARVLAVRAEVLGTAGPELFGTYAFDVAAELAAYSSRIALSCSSTEPAASSR